MGVKQAQPAHLTQLTFSGNGKLTDGAHRLHGSARSTVSTEVIGPATAAAMLQQNYQHNRQIKSARVERLVADIQAGRFLLSPDCITFDVNGNLINGQHRLTACVKSGIPIEAYVVRGADPESYKVTDQGSVRTVADLSGGRITNITHKASIAAQWLQLIETHDSVVSGDGTKRVTRGRVRYAGRNRSRGEMLETVEKYADLLEWGTGLLPKSGTTLMKPSSTFIAVACLIADVMTHATGDQEELKTIEDYFAGIADTSLSNSNLVYSGEELATDHPFSVVRSELEKISRKEPSVTKANEQKITAILQGWNAYVTGKPMKAKRNQDHDFPVIVPQASFVPRHKRGKWASNI